jgi:hypothetical protein
MGRCSPLGSLHLMVQPVQQIVLSGRLLSPVKLTAILRWLGHKRQQLGDIGAITRAAFFLCNQRWQLYKLGF